MPARFPFAARVSAMVVLTTAGLAPLIAAETARAEESLREIIDKQVAAVWQREKVLPAAPASDAEFLRRVYLDVVGTIPTYPETVAFLADKATDKRAKLIDLLLLDPRHAQHQADIWDQVLFGRNPPGYDTDKRDGIQRWLREQFAQNRPYDQWARELLRAEGNSVEQGPPMFYVQYKGQPEDASEAISQTFLGVQLQCARCHDHPFEPWTQLDFYGMAAFIARLDVVTVGKKDNLNLYAIAEKSDGDVLFTGPAKDQQPGKKGEPVKPKFLLGDPLVEPPLPEGFKQVKFENNKPPTPPLFSRKNQLADWIARPDNRLFGRSIANRVWAQYMGRGLVHPISNMSESNTPSHPELLDTLHKQLVAHQFDLRWLAREILNSRTYQLASQGPSALALPQWFEQARTRPLSAEELLESWRTAAGYADTKNDQKNPSRFRPLGSDYMLRYFGQPTNGLGDFQGGLHEHLYLNNGQIGNLIVATPGSLIEAVSHDEMPWSERVDRLFLQVLNRPVEPAEREKWVAVLSAKKDAREPLKDAVWALLTCSEFRFNH